MRQQAMDSVRGAMRNTRRYVALNWPAVEDYHIWVNTQFVVAIQVKDMLRAPIWNSLFGHAGDSIYLPPRKQKP